MGEQPAVIDQRPTPADPLPGVSVDRSIPGPKRTLPPELGPDAIAVLEGRTFMYSDSVGDVPKGSIGGLVHADTRFLSRWALTINGAPFLVLRAGIVDYYSAEFFLTNPRLEGLEANSVGLRRLRFVGDGLHERLELESYLREPLRIQLHLAVDNDFADLFEIKDRVRDRSEQIVRTPAPDRSGLTFSYANQGFSAQTTLETSAAATRIDDEGLAWTIDLPARGTWTCELHVPLRLGPRELQPTHAGFGDVFGSESEDPVGAWLDDLPRLDTDSHLLGEVVGRTARDLVALRIEAQYEDQALMLPAAGLPWFLTLFGRDTLITAYQTVAFGPRLAKGALLALAFFQATERDDFRDMEPGKILHELRMGELTQLGLKPHRPYYGSADSTPLWLILLSEYWRWSGDTEVVSALRDNALAALAWIDQFGDRDGDGYVEYGTRSSQGLGNQCWRDSYDGVLFADGSMPVLPIATAEIQGYVYDAKIRLAELADGPFADPALAARLRLEATALRERFERDFWIDARGGYYAIGLDGDKRPIDSLTSNIGQLAVDRDRVRGARRGRCPPADGRAAVLGLGHPDAVDRRRRVQPDRLPPWHGLAARQLDHRVRPGALRIPRGGEPDRAGDARRRGVLGLPVAGGVLRVPAVARPVPGSLPDRVQSAGLGDRGAAAPAPGDARPRGTGRAGDPRPGPAGRDRPGHDQRPARLRHALGRGGGRAPGQRSILARGLISNA